MSNPALITPNGGKVRSQSQRRYALVIEYQKLNEDNSPSGLWHDPYVARRSDNPTTLTDFAGRERRNGRMRGCKAYVFDLRSGTMLRVLDAQTHRYRVVYSTSRGGFSEFSAADDRAAWTQAEGSAYGARIIQLMEVRSGNPDHVRMLEKI